MVTITRPSPPPSLEQLIDTALPGLRKSHRAEGKPRRGGGNLPALLRRACTALGVSLTDPVTVVLGPALDASRRQIVLDSELGASERRNLRWALARWQVLLATHYPRVIAADAVRVPTRRPRLVRLGETLRGAMQRASMSLQQLAQRSEVSYTKLDRWLRGQSLPDARSTADLARVEAALGIPAGSLGEFLRQYRSRAGAARTRASDWAVTGQLPKARQLRRPKPAQIPECVRVQWRQLVADHLRGAGTRTDPARAGTGWGVRALAAGETTPWFMSVGGGMCATAGRHWNTVMSFWGYLATPEGSSRLGIGPEAVVSLAWLVVPEAVEGYLRFLIERAGGQANANVASFKGLVSLLCSERAGWLRQREAQLRPSLPPSYRDRDWQQICDAALQSVSDPLLQADPAERDWDDFMRNYFQHEDPATPVLAAIATLQREADGLRADSLERARMLRDAALLSFLLMVPLRTGTLSRIEHATPARHVLVHGDEMKLNLPARLFKNGAKRGPLKTVVAGELVHVVRRYLDEARPVLCAGVDSRWLLISSRHPQRPWSLVSTQVSAITARLCGRGIPAHLFRHLVARRFLRQRPQDYVGVAALLHDSLQTVLERYASKDPTGALSSNAANLRLPREQRGGSGG